MSKQSNLIQVVQLPVIEERLRLMKETVEKQVSEALALVCNDETLAQVRTARADLNKTFNDLEEQRKTVKKAVMGPYEQFEAVYKECISDPFRRADAALKEKIGAVESEIKGACEAEMRDYFSELCASEHLDWLKFEWVGLKIDLASARQKSHGKLREQIAGFVSDVAQAVNTISRMEDAEEIMVEYRQCLDMGRAIGIIQERNQRIEDERAAAEARKSAMEAQRAAVEKVYAAAPPVAAPPIQAPEPEKVFPRFTFTVLNATKAQLIRVREFLKQEGISYE